MRNWMRQARKSSGLTLRETALKLGISESYYSLIERGERQEKLDCALPEKVDSKKLAKTD